MVKKCPVCNSTRYKKVGDESRCARCGFTNKSSNNIKKHISRRN